MPNLSLLSLGLLAISPVFAADELLVNRLGYELHGPKTAIVKGGLGSVEATGFEVLDAAGKRVLAGSAGPSEVVEGWGKAAYRVVDFSALADSGTFRLVTLPSGDTAPVVVRNNNLLRTAGPAVVEFFHKMRSTNVGDKAVGYFGEPGRGTHNVYGGWNDATGDGGKYLSHLSYANTMNPQQIPMVVWSLLRSRLLAPATTESFKAPLLAEAAWGADYLLRVQDLAGYFYINIFDRWGADPRKISAWTGTAAAQGTMTGDYQAAWREGGGMSIAALALAARLGVNGDSSSAQYLAGAKRGFEHLSAKPGRWADDGKENLIDHYCALLAAVELYQATKEARYLDAAGMRADSLVARQKPDGWMVADGGVRPFYHGVDEGLPLMALWAYLEADPESARSKRVRASLAKSVAWYHTLTRGVANPFVYPRMYAPLAPATGPGGTGNVALGKKAWATEVEAGNPAASAFDGKDDKGHRWSAYRSGLTADLGAYQATLVVDLDGRFLLSQATLSWEEAFATKYRVLVAGADSTKWQVVAAVDNGKGGKEVLRFADSVWARYVKVECLKRSVEYGGYSILEMTITGQKEFVPVLTMPSKDRFFMPHNNETEYWWQGENARLGSMAAGLLLAGRTSGWNFGQDSLSAEIIGPLDWVVGKNTHNINFMYGVAGGDYASYNVGRNAVGGICNGITSTSDSDGTPVFVNSGAVANWRWVEQWLPHNANFLLGAAALAHSQEFGPYVGVHKVEKGFDRFRVRQTGVGIEVESDVSGTWVLRNFQGRVVARAEETSTRFAVPRGAWLVQHIGAKGTRDARVVMVP